MLDAHAPDTSQNPATSDAGSPPPPLTPAITIGQQIAGGLLIANAAFVLLSAALIPVDPKLGPMFAPSRSIMPALLDVAIGVSLLSGKTKYLVWAILRVVLGTLLFTTLAWTKDPVLAGSQLMIGTSLLLLLLGNAGRPRLLAGGALFFFYALLNISGVSATVLGVNPLAPIFQTILGDIEPRPVSLVIGESSHYCVRAPSARWHLRTTAAAKKTNPLADRWLTRPDLDAHVLIVAEKEPGKRISADALADVVVENARKSASEFEVLGREPMRSHPRIGRIVHNRSLVEQLELESLSSVIATYEHGYQLIAFAPRKSFPKVEAELRSIIESFELPTDEKPGLPEDVEPVAVKRIVGQRLPYVLSAPDGIWYLRKDAAAKQTNELADRWIVRPELDAHIMIIPELVEGADLTADRYAAAVADTLRQSIGATIVSTEPVKADPEHGRVLHVTATVRGLHMEYSYGCFARGEQAYQVVAFASREDYPALRAAFRQAIESFQLPAPRPSEVARKSIRPKHAK